MAWKLLTPAMQWCWTSEPLNRTQIGVIPSVSGTIYSIGCTLLLPWIESTRPLAMWISVLKTSHVPVQYLLENVCLPLEYFHRLPRRRDVTARFFQHLQCAFDVNPKIYQVNGGKTWNLIIPRHLTDKR